MSEMFTREQRDRIARLNVTPTPDRTAVLGKWTGALGCLALVTLLLLALGALTVGAWRWALRG